LADACVHHGHLVFLLDFQLDGISQIHFQLVGRLLLLAKLNPDFVFTHVGLYTRVFFCLLNRGFLYYEFGGLLAVNLFFAAFSRKVFGGLDFVKIDFYKSLVSLLGILDFHKFFVQRGLRWNVLNDFFENDFLRDSRAPVYCQIANLIVRNKFDDPAFFTRFNFKSEFLFLKFVFSVLKHVLLPVSEGQVSQIVFEAEAFIVLVEYKLFDFEFTFLVFPKAAMFGVE